MSEILPAILAKDIKEFKEQMASIPEEVKFVHVDVLEEDIWEDIDKDFEVHLMVKNPEAIIERWVNRGAKRIILHSLGSSTSKWRETVEVGLAVELNVPLGEVFPLLTRADFIQLMSIAEIGEQGHMFEPAIFDRIREVKEKFPQILLSVDGGINVTNYQELQKVGVERLVVGSGFKDLWKSLTKN